MTEEKNDEIQQDAESQDESAADSNESNDRPNDVIVSGDEARKYYSAQIDAAIKYAGNNRYEYGPRMRETELQWDVSNVERMANDIVRVTLEYSPTSGFRGDPGTEYLDVDANGEILARRQTRVPKENKPVVLMGIAAFSVVLALVLISMMTFIDQDGGDPLYVAGRTLWIRAEVPKTQQFIIYKGADTQVTLYNWALVPDDESENELAFVEVTIHNQTSGSVRMVVDEEAATLLDTNNRVYEPINTIERAYTAEFSEKFNVPGFQPMWGSIELNEKQQVVGMLVFEVPKDSGFKELRWSASDTASIKYQ